MDAKHAQAKEYELLAKELYKAILNSEGVKTIDVKHDVTIKGKSGAVHQFDVYWEFSVAGIEYRTCIECKHLSTRVKKSHVTDFAAKIEDIGNAHGVFITNKGYQNGAKEYAKYKNIKILLLNYLLKSIGMEANIGIPSTEVMGIVVDVEYVKELKKKWNLETIGITYSLCAESMMCDINGNETFSLVKLIQGLRLLEGSNSYKLDSIYFRTDYGPIKIDSINIKHTVTYIKQNWSVDVNNTTKAILEDILSDDVILLKDDGSASKSPNKRVFDAAVIS